MKPNIKIVNLDGSEIEREMNKDEYEQFLKDQDELKIKIDAQQKNEEKRLLLLERLGITEDEAKLLLS